MTEFTARGWILNAWESWGQRGGARAHIEGISYGEPVRITVSDLTGLPTVHLGKIITGEDVRRLEDDE